MTKLARDCGLSDVSLRKICVALYVPLSPKDYWAKLATGRTIPKPALPETKLPKTYKRTTNVAEVEAVREERVTTGELDAQIEVMSGTLRKGFVKK